MRKLDSIVISEAQAKEMRNVCKAAHCGLITDYSGRNMFGQLCFGITFDNPMQLTAVGALLSASSNWRFVLDLLNKNACQDNFGMGQIVYFPQFQWPAKEGVCKAQR